MRPLTLLLSLALVAACSKDSKDEPSKPPAPAPAEQPAPGAQRPAPPHGAGGPGAMQPGPAAAKNADGRYAIGSLTLVAPDDWSSQPVSSGMRRAQFALPAADGDTDPTELVVYYFGNAGAGTLQANLDRWYGQFEQPDGSDSKSKAKTETIQVSGMKVTTVDVSGHYVAAMQPGAAEKHDKPDHRMLAAIVEAPDGAYYFKLIGPEKSVAAHKAAFGTAINSIQSAN